MEVEQEHPTGICGVSGTFCQWSFQEPKLEVPTIYIRPM